MADEKEKPKEKPPTTIEDDHKKMATEIITLLFIMFVLMTLLNGISKTFNLGSLFQNGWKGLTPKGLALSGTRPLASVLNPINARVLVSAEETTVYDEAGGKKIGTHSFGDYGRVLRGPVTVNGEKYFYVDFEKGVDGWVKEKDLAYKEPTIRKLSKDDPLGSDVLARGDTTVLDFPGGVVVGNQPAGAKGFVTQGPIEKDGKRYWFVDFEEGSDGWVEEGNLSHYNNGTRHLSEKDGVGSAVITASSGTAIYDENGIMVGQQENGRHGKIKRGPLFINGEKYWFVDFEDGQDGWVKESDLRVQTKREKSLGEKISFYILLLISILKYLLIAGSIVLFVWVVYLIKNLTNIRQNVRTKLFPTLALTEPKLSHNPKWERVMTHVESLNQSDWRLAILEADIMLDEMLGVMGLFGETISDKLKSIERSDFTTIDLAWEGHKVRNRIAHDGADFVLTQRETRRVISLYEAVFKEFSYI